MQITNSAILTVLAKAFIVKYSKNINGNLDQFQFLDFSSRFKAILKLTMSRNHNFVCLCQCANRWSFSARDTFPHP